MLKPKHCKAINCYLIGFGAVMTGLLLGAFIDNRLISIPVMVVIWGYTMLEIIKKYDKKVQK